MRETLKSFSTLTAVLTLALFTVGCTVNVPGCGKRSLPLFKKVTETLPLPAPSSQPNVELNLSLPAPTPAVKASAGPVSTAAKPLSLTAAPAPKPTPVPVDVELIAYTTMERGKPTLWTMNTDGTNRTRLTPVGTSSWHPLWSPNGKNLAFLSDIAGGKVNLFVLDKGSAQAKQLTFYADMKIPDSKSPKASFSWSPNSDEIAYVYHRQLWKTSLTGASDISLATVDLNHSIVAAEWAPAPPSLEKQAGEKRPMYVAYLVRKGDMTYSLWLANPRLLDQLKLAESAGPVLDISWSFDDNNVAYVVGDNSLIAASPHSSSTQAILDSPSLKLGNLLRFAPEGKSSAAILILAKKTAEDRGYRLALVSQSKPATAGITQTSSPQSAGTLTFLTEPGVDYADWSPDGSKIIYTQAGELWMMNPDGSGKNLVAATGVQFPDWSRK